MNAAIKGNVYKANAYATQAPPGMTVVKSFVLTTVMEEESV